MVNTKMTAIADKIRSILGITGKMGLDAMASNLEKEQSNIAAAFTSVESKGGAVPESKVSGNLASAIASIPEGVTVQRRESSFTTSTNGTATVSCGFKPDFVTIYLTTYDGNEEGLSFPFAEQDNPSNPYRAIGYYSNGIYDMTANRSTTGFSIKVVDGGWDSDTTPANGKTFDYIAIKYTQ